jgi:hypothetical protein
MKCLTMATRRVQVAFPQVCLIRKLQSNIVVMDAPIWHEHHRAPLRTESVLHVRMICKRIFNKQDMAAEKLFTNVAQSVWQKRTNLIFYHLLDNYERITELVECSSQRECKEQWVFLRACMQTRPMQYCFRYLVIKVRPSIVCCTHLHSKLRVSLPIEPAG